ncbi:MAG TPA: alpha/beta hydrolase [Thermoanaerobaculia bacterium]
MLERVDLGVFPQWILIRGAHRSAPVLLFLHGGPGMPAMYLAHAFSRELESRFVVAHWDRLGAGKSFAPGIPPAAMSVEREISDARELCERLRERLGARKIYLVGHSYGSYLGTLLVRRHPDLFAAYVGVGQVTDPSREREAQDRFLRKKAAETGNRELAAEIDRGTVDRERWLFEFGGELHAHRSFWPLVWTGLRAPEYRLVDVANVRRGVAFTHRHMIYDAIAGSLDREVRSLDVPVYFFLGRFDRTAPSELSAEFLARLQAPFKKLVWFERSAHFPFLEEPSKFAAEMARVREETENR